MANFNPNEEHKELWLKFIAGDDGAYASLYRCYVNKLFVFGCRFTSNEELVKDCVQDLFVKFYATRKRLPKVENVKVYLFNSMKNMLFNLFKKELPYYQIDTIEPVFYTEFNGETRIIQAETLSEQKESIRKMMENITPRQREVLYYRFVEEMSYEEICELMKMNYQSVRNLIHRTLLKIRSTAKDNRNL
ncbi:MAG: RNA polymerase sigma factor [Tannerella sp.]|jgi:RNA polymerase sigma factor (sigma-70 family)|nr:RNA polymerase sigma factor [Tannerella sp.]